MTKIESGTLRELMSAGRLTMSVNQKEMRKLLAEMPPSVEDWLYVSIDLKWREGAGGNRYEVVEFDPGIGRKKWDGSIPEGVLYDVSGSTVAVCRVWRETVFRTDFGSIRFITEDIEQ